jgi:glycosyltransferase involved in cell wall biosynthesis
VRDNETGLLAEERSAVNLASCLSRLLADAELRRTLGSEGRRHVEEKFDIERQSEALELIYEEVLKRASGGRA